MRKLSIPFFVVLFVFSACEKTEKVEDFPQHQSKLVANCFFMPDSPFVFNLSKSLSPLDNAQFKNLVSPSAFIKVFENNILFDSFRVFNNKFRGDSTKIAKAGNMYRFECYYPGFGVVKGEDYLPDTLKLLRAEGANRIKVTNKVNDTLTFVLHRSTLDLDLQSLNARGNYLLVSVYRVYKFYNYPKPGQTYIQRYGVSISETNRIYDSDVSGYGLYIPDDGRSLTQLRLAWDMNGYYKDGKISCEYDVVISSFSKVSYEYLHRQMLQMDNQNDPFAQPTPISNNIMNGFGVFGGMAKQHIHIVF